MTDDPIANFITAILLQRSKGGSSQRASRDSSTPQPMFRPDGSSGSAGPMLDYPASRGQTPPVYRPVTTPRRGL